MAAIVLVLGETTVTVREMTVAEVRAWVAEHEAGLVVDPIGAMVFDDCSLADLARMCDLPADAMEIYTLQQLAPLRDKCKALNPHFFRTREALVSVSRAIQAGLDSPSSTAASQP